MSRWRVTETGAGDDAGSREVEVTDQPVALTDDRPGQRALPASAEPPVRALVDTLPAPNGRNVVEVVVDGWRFELRVEDAARAGLRERAARDRGAAGAGGPLQVRAVIPGRVVSLSVAEGTVVAAGEPLLVIEAMKMQNELRAPRAGTVERLAVTAGATVERGDLLAVLA